ncbi:MAG: hypothetical protein CVT63_01445 [Candidatus Anoxymicrobium japonicum]|uniref:Uncharacterized protein n=1 Tax=Candidatus Anoxymicrobium japonicum TaxID=2013648 RepID=A0A2N3G7K8_9ACTN|nr:MAG: hypothetical protein CVT63_01445 [Candidatus Anoxymicrobium japonicum]
MTHVRRVMDRLCIVCGHNLGPYGRICDKCGSIQRPIAGSGTLFPPDKFIPCEKCDAPVLEETGKTVCEECIKKNMPHPIIVFEDADKYKRVKTIAMAGGSASLATLIGCGILLVFIGGAWLIALIALSSAGLFASGAVLMITSKRSTSKIEYYAPIKPEQKQGG